MPEGTIKWYDEKKGYGFIAVEGEEDIFFHSSGIQDQGYFGIQKNDAVVFEVKVTPRGKQAVRVRPR